MSNNEPEMPLGSSFLEEVTELMGLAMGHKEAGKWLSRHLTDPIKLLSNKGLL